MKKAIITALTAFIFFGCASTPPSDEAMKEVAKEEAAAVAEAAEEKATEIIEVEVAHLMKEVRFFRDGSVDSYRELTHEEGTGRILDEKSYDSFGNLKESIIYLYPEEGLVRRELKDAAGKVLSYDLLRYDAAGNLLSEASFSPQDEPAVSSRYDYDSRGNRVGLTVRSGSGAILSRIEYSYQGSLDVKGILIGADEAVRNTFIREYDDQDRLVRETILDRKGEKEKEVVYVYEGEFLITEEHLNNAGGLSRRFHYENDEKGSPVKISMENSRGIILETVERSYFYTTEERILED